MVQSPGYIIKYVKKWYSRVIKSVDPGVWSWFKEQLCYFISSVNLDKFLKPSSSVFHL